MNNLENIDLDPTAKERKQDHIQLAFQSQVNSLSIDNRFNYEPILAAHPQQNLPKINFLHKEIQTPIWVSSMTGGTEKAFLINQNLAKACAYFGMGMGLGSCRSLLDANDRLKDFDFRKIIGNQLPFYANIGIAQLEILIKNNELFKLHNLVDKLAADGIIIHINPLQEWLQPEGDKINEIPLTTIKKFLDSNKNKVIIKEVGQGFGKESLKALLQLPIDAIEFAAHGGTNFSKLELLRSNTSQQELYSVVSNIGHSATEMVDFVNELQMTLGNKVVCKEFIISGGIKNFIDGYYLMQKLQAKSIYGQASELLKYAEKGYDDLHQFLEKQIEGLKLANAYFKIK